jgi:hypothetical protein
MEETDHDALADQLEAEAGKLQQHSDELGDEVKDTREDWERKRADAGVPGAPPKTGDEGDTGQDEHEAG